MKALKIIISLLLTAPILFFSCTDGYFADKAIDAAIYPRINEMAAIWADAQAANAVPVAEMEPEVEAEPEYYHLDVGSNHEEWDSLLTKNNEVIGWISIPGLIDGYPVVLRNDPETGNEYYLHRSLSGSYSAKGTIFMDFRCRVEPGYMTQNMTLYGHHQKNGEMFGNLRELKKISGIKKWPIIQFDTLYEEANYLIFSVFITNTLEKHGEIFDYRNPNFNTQEEFLEFIEQCRKRSFYNMPVDVQADDTIITLSTCSYEYDEFRLVVMGRKVRAGEESTVHVSEITENPNILYPDVWYR